MSDQNISRYHMYNIKRKVEPELSAVNLYLFVQEPL